MCCVKSLGVKCLQILAIAGLSLLAFGVAEADDVHSKKGSGRESARVDKQDAKAGPSQHGQRPRAKQAEQTLVYAERAPKVKLPWEPNAPGD
jgi:hypothetical protein